METNDASQTFVHAAVMTSVPPALADLIPRGI
jgi:hypothetical protein